MDLNPRRKFCCLALTAALASLGMLRSAHAQSSITHCDASAVAAFLFSNGVEFPGAQGSISVGAGHSETGAHIEYDLTAGKYVAATLPLTIPMNATAVGLWVRSTLDARPELQLRDASGQTLVYNLVRPLEATADESNWYHLVIDVTAPTDHFGGPNDGVWHPPFSSVAIVVSSASASKGSVNFDELETLDSISGLVDLAAPLSVESSAGTSLTNRLAINVHGANQARALDAAHDIGFRAIRVDLNWESIERTRGNYDFSELDTVVANLESRGMRLHLIVDYGNALYPGPTSRDYAQTTLPAFAQMAQTVAKRYAGKKVSYEIWNEPNAERFWPVAAGPTVYASLAKTATQAIHAGDPQASVSTGGLAGFDFDFLKASLQAGAAQGASALGLHPYRYDGAESVGNDLLQLQKLLSQMPAGPLPIWATEWGYSSTWEGDGHASAARNRQAQLAVREVLSSWSKDFPLIVYYDLQDDGTDPTDPEHNFGLLQFDFTEKPAAPAVRTLIRVAGDRTFAGWLDTGVSGLHAMRLNGARDTVVALWSERGALPISVRLPANSTVSDMLGAARVTKAVATGNEITLSEADGPLYIMFPPTTVSDPSANGGAAGMPNSAGGASAGTAAASEGGSSAGALGTAGAASPGGSAAVGAGGTASGGALFSLGDISGGSPSGGAGAATSSAAGALTSSGAPNAGSANGSQTTSSGCSCSLAGQTSGSSQFSAAGAALFAFAGRLRRRARRLTAQLRT